MKPRGATTVELRDVFPLKILHIYEQFIGTEPIRPEKGCVFGIGLLSKRSGQAQVWKCIYVMQLGYQQQALTASRYHPAVMWPTSDAAPNQSINALLKAGRELNVSSPRYTCQFVTNPERVFEVFQGMGADTEVKLVVSVGPHLARTYITNVVHFCPSTRERSLS